MNTQEKPPASPELPPEPQKLPYEDPRVVKKRSVLRATLFTGGGITSQGLTSMG